jgi:hypothetical protein
MKARLFLVVLVPLALLIFLPPAWAESPSSADDSAAAQVRDRALFEASSKNFTEKYSMSEWAAEEVIKRFRTSAESIPLTCTAFRSEPERGQSPFYTTLGTLHLVPGETPDSQIAIFLPADEGTSENELVSASYLEKVRLEAVKRTANKGEHATTTISPLDYPLLKEGNETLDRVNEKFLVQLGDDNGGPEGSQELFVHQMPTGKLLVRIRQFGLQIHKPTAVFVCKQLNEKIPPRRALNPRYYSPVFSIRQTLNDTTARYRSRRDSDLSVRDILLEQTSPTQIILSFPGGEPCSLTELSPTAGSLKSMGDLKLTDLKFEIRDENTGTIKGRLNSMHGAGQLEYRIYEGADRFLFRGEVDEGRVVIEGSLGILQNIKMSLFLSRSDVRELRANPLELWNILSCFLYSETAEARMLRDATTMEQGLGELLNSLEASLTKFGKREEPSKQKLYSDRLAIKTGIAKLRAELETKLSETDGRWELHREFLNHTDRYNHLVATASSTEAYCRESWGSWGTRVPLLSYEESRALEIVHKGLNVVTTDEVLSALNQAGFTDENVLKTGRRVRNRYQLNGLMALARSRKASGCEDYTLNISNTWAETLFIELMQNGEAWIFQERFGAKRLDAASKIQSQDQSDALRALLANGHDQGLYPIVHELTNPHSAAAFCELAVKGKASAPSLKKTKFVSTKLQLDAIRALIKSGDYSKESFESALKVTNPLASEGFAKASAGGLKGATLEVATKITTQLQLSALEELVWRGYKGSAELELALSVENDLALAAFKTAANSKLSKAHLKLAAKMTSKDQSRAFIQLVKKGVTDYPSYQAVVGAQPSLK